MGHQYLLLELELLVAIYGTMWEDMGSGHSWDYDI
jgi:hypothetical protein